MTIKELKDWLAHYDENTTIVVRDSEGEWGTPRLARYHTDDTQTMILYAD